ncbi:hypothetical protein MPPM_3480 [Methylorubrum populi]|uniref:Glycoside hydrolase family 19 catalytic domain-containing protein n=1 Tax=Methylorubrum populi TaxID=223967 RepID=A0A160PH84_9HYPH|nr:hypothetical protein [Methylorubrum populi]BAU92085.1 hypothetical protein MPPM_3480 [Methylorubrum populi]
MSINRKFFFEEVKLRLFDGSMRPSQVSSLNGILDAWESRTARSDDRWLAYMLGTTHHETGRTMQPVRETFASTDDKAIAILSKAWKAGKLPWVERDYWSRDADGKSWLGRGFVQLTHKTNYQKMSNLTGEDLVSHPENAMKIPVATKILIEGMIAGSFTGKKLGDYFNQTKEDWVNARRIINGVERAELVASYARKYYAAISYTL